MIQSDYRGVEFDWFATDRDGRVGFFTSAGSGLVPEVVLRHQEANELLRAFFEERVDRNDPKRTITTDEWRRMANLGLYAYDSSPNGGAYQLKAAPETPRLLQDFPAEAAHALSRLPISLAFSESPTIDPHDLGLSAA